MLDSEEKHDQKNFSLSSYTLILEDESASNSGAATGAELGTEANIKGQGFPNRARHARPRRHRFNQVHLWAEFISFIVIVASGPVAILELHNHTTELRNNASKERLALAEQVYRSVDQRFTEFTKLCLDHPRLDCYSVAQNALKPPLTATERLQQRILYANLTDVFEVAYVEFHKKEVSEKVKELFDDQWAGWDAYIRKFMKRRAYLNTWLEIRDEYDKGLVQYMDQIARPEVAIAAGKGHGAAR